ncbi:28S ribosomal protein S5, mitochondrial [Ascosphaera acerosa]|nr:28S ribosomal protein S5, mitochondrial [Ascosphaera acerosa]
MSGAVRPARCLLCAFARPSATAATAAIRSSQRPFHASIARKQSNVPPGDDGQPPASASASTSASTPPSSTSSNNNGAAATAPPSAPPVARIQDIRPEHFRAYTPEEKARLAKAYSPAQLAAIEAGEASIDPRDLAAQWALRADADALAYIDDFSTVEPVVDHHVRAPPTDDRGLRLKTPDEVLDQVADYLADEAGAASAVGASDAADSKAVDSLMEYLEKMSFAHGDTSGGRTDVLVPDIMDAGETLETIGEKPTIKRLQALSRAKSDALTPELEALVKVTGYHPDQIRGLRVKTLVSHAVVNQTRLGKVRKTYMLSIAGNGNGLLGVGEGKSEDASAARVQSQYAAIRNMQPILRYEGRTIFGDVTGKVGAVELKLMHRPPGFGLRCQQYIWEMCRAAGIQDIAARVARSRNAMNTVKAAYEALRSQRNPEDIARARGRKLVDVRKVYYAGNV